MLLPISKDNLVEQAIKARDKAYAPYSQVHVGAALLTSDGQIYLGADVENADAFTSICAERMAFCNAVFDGHTSFHSIAIAGWHKNSEPSVIYPCKYCIQVMKEFCAVDTFEIILIGSKSNTLSIPLATLLRFLTKK